MVVQTTKNEVWGAFTDIRWTNSGEGAKASERTFVWKVHTPNENKENFTAYYIEDPHGDWDDSWHPIALPSEVFHD